MSSWKQAANNVRIYVAEPLMLGFSFGVAYLGTFYFLKSKILWFVYSHYILNTNSCTTNLSYLHPTFYYYSISFSNHKTNRIEDWFIIDLISYHYMEMLFFLKLRCNSIITNKIMDLLKTLPILVFDIDGTLLFRTT